MSGALVSGKLLNRLTSDMERLERSIVAEVLLVALETIETLEESLIDRYASAPNFTEMKQRFISLAVDVAKLITVLPELLDRSLNAFPYWIHRSERYDLIDEWSDAAREASSIVWSRTIVAEALKIEIARMIGYYGEVLAAHAFTATPVIPVTELPVKSGSDFVLYQNACCYSRPIEIPDALFDLLSEYGSNATQLAQEHRDQQEMQRKKNIAQLRDETARVRRSLEPDNL